NITGTATLSGALSVAFTNGFLPSATNSFIIMTYASHVGTFSTAAGLRATNGILFIPQYNSTNLVLVATNDLRLQSVRLSGTNVSFDFQTVSGFNYLVQYTDSLNPPNWLPLVTISGDNTLKTITDPITASTQRFYRVVIQ